MQCRLYICEIWINSKVTLVFLYLKWRQTFWTWHWLWPLIILIWGKDLPPGFQLKDASNTIMGTHILKKGFPGGSDGKGPPCNAGEWSSILSQEDPLERKWLPTPVFLPEELQGQRSLASYSPQGLKELDTTDWLTHTY